MGISFKLKMSRGTDVKELSLDQPVTTVGRSTDNSIVLDDAQVSRHHAQIDFSEGKPRITDLDSSNGTLVNGAKIKPNEPYGLKEGDSVGIGDYVFTISSVAPVAPVTEEKPAAKIDEPVTKPVKKKKFLRGKVLAGLIAGAVIVLALGTALVLAKDNIRHVLTEQSTHGLAEMPSQIIEGLNSNLKEIFGHVKPAGEPPVINAFYVDPESITQGDACLLEWAVSGATEVSIDHGIGTVSFVGNREVSPPDTDTYILTASNSSGSITRSVTVEVTAESTQVALPVIKSFVASPDSINKGENSILDWDVTGATSVSITPGASSVPETGSATSAPSTTTTYVLTATNEAGSVTESVTVTVNAASSPPAPVAAPVILSFAAEPDAVDAGSNVMLTWNVTGATSLSIDNGIGQIPFSSGYMIVRPYSTVTYTMTAINTAGSVTDTATILVAAASPATVPVINSFTASPTSITAGGSSLLSWSVTGATFVSITPGAASLPASGSATSSPVTTTTYTLTATNIAGSVTRQVTVTVAAAPAAVPVINYFTASPTSITAGGSSTLGWSVTGATSISITPGAPSVPASGSATCSPASTTTYTLTATNTAGSVTRQVTVTVAAAPAAVPVINSFTASPTSITAGGSSTLGWSVTGATSISIAPGAPSVPASGSATCSPASTTTYTLTATNSAGSVTRQVTVTVTAAPPPSPAETASCEQALFNAVNAVRASNGIPALTRNSYIDGLCRQHAQYMANAGTLSHDNFNARADSIRASIPGMNACAENVLYNFTPCNATAMAQQWYDSPGHRTNMLNPAYTISGMGIVIDSSGKIWACQIFAGP